MRSINLITHTLTACESYNYTAESMYPVFCTLEQYCTSWISHVSLIIIHFSVARAKYNVYNYSIIPIDIIICTITMIHCRGLHK